MKMAVVEGNDTPPSAVLMCGPQPSDRRLASCMDNTRTGNIGAISAQRDLQDNLRACEGWDQWDQWDHH
jgi:hypothetical protein